WTSDWARGTSAPSGDAASFRGTWAVSPAGALRLRRRRARRGGRWRLVASRVLHLALVLGLHPRHPAVERRLTLLLREGRADALRRLRQGLCVARLGGGERLDQVVAVLGLDRLGDLAGLERERGFLELGNKRPLDVGVLAASRLRRAVLGVLLDERREIGPRLELTVELVRERFRLREIDLRVRHALVV